MQDCFGCGDEQAADPHRDEAVQAVLEELHLRQIQAVL